MSLNHDKDASKSKSERIEKFYQEERRRQPGVTFPSARKQQHLLIIRFDISMSTLEDTEKRTVRDGLLRICSYFDAIEKGTKKRDILLDDGTIKPVNLSEFDFSMTLGLGFGFFQKLKVNPNNIPKKLKQMPNHIALGDSVPYRLVQTDFLIQLCSNNEDINNWVFQHLSAKQRTPHQERRQHERYFNERTLADPFFKDEVDLYSAITDWATITDIHTGFQRIDGKNLLGFNDGISNPRRLSNDVVWTTAQDEVNKLTGGTYMVFQKIEHDLQRWKEMTVEIQEEWIGRSKYTGLLLGTLPKEEDRKLALNLHSNDPATRAQAQRMWKKLYDEQKDPNRRFFDVNMTQYRGIQLQCPVWSHVRKSNPREADGAAKSLIFRRGYLFSERGLNGLFDSGLLFICFQRNIETGFELIKKKFINNKNFPVPNLRKNLNRRESESGLLHGLYTKDQLRKRMQGNSPTSPMTALKTIEDSGALSTGKDGLSGPSELGAHPEGQYPITVTLGGGYYFIPPIPHKKISEITEQFFS